MQHLSFDVLLFFTELPFWWSKKTCPYSQKTFIDFSMLRSKTPVQRCVFCASYHFVHRQALKTWCVFCLERVEREYNNAASFGWVEDSLISIVVWVLHPWVLTMHVNALRMDSLIFLNFTHSPCLGCVHYYPFDFLKNIWIEWNNFAHGMITALLKNITFHLVVCFWHLLKDTKIPQQQKEKNSLKYGNRKFYCSSLCHCSANDFIAFTITSSVS